MDIALRVFVPHELPACQDPGLLVGWCQAHPQSDHQIITVFIFGLIPYQIPHAAVRRGPGTSQIRLLGSFEPSAPVAPLQRVVPDSDEHVQLHVRLTAAHQLDVARARVGGTLVASPSERCDLVLYDPSLFTGLDPEVIRRADRRSVSLVQAMSAALHDFRGSTLSEAPGMVDFTLMAGSQSLTTSFRTAASSALATCVAVIAGIICALLCKSGMAFFVGRTAKFSVCAQLKTRLQQLDYLVKSVTSPGREMRFWNTSAAILADFLLGLLLTAVLYRTISTVLLLDVFLEWTNFFSLVQLLVGNLRSLLVWLMGNPAGFKLNSQLSSSMGNFFNYHIYLWEAYLYIIKPALEVMLAGVFYCGVLGLTFQLGILSDLFTFATFHVYCFYAYAAKLYRLNFVGLISYWRLFRGKKWNPLRKRVDSCTYDVYQLFMGTLCFTTLLFLLPTTLLYYVVFTILRIPILLLQGVIHKAMRFIDQLALYSLILYVMGSKRLVGKVNFTVVPGRSLDGPLILSMKGESCSFSDAIFKFLPLVAPREDRVTGWALLKDLLMGKLIYPI